jgi:hypothetical protein
MPQYALSDHSDFANRRSSRIKKTHYLHLVVVYPLKKACALTCIYLR